MQEIKGPKHVIRTLRKEKYQDIHVRVEQERELLLKLLTDMLTTPTTSLVQQEKTQLSLLNDLINAEEDMLRQK